MSAGGGLWESGENGYSHTGGVVVVGSNPAVPTNYIKA